MGLILLIILLLLIIGALPVWPHSRSWNAGYAPSGLVGLLLIVLLVLLLFDVVRWI